MDNTLRIILFQFYILIIYSATIFGQNIDNDTIYEESTYIKINNIEGIILAKNYPYNKTLNKKYVRWIPNTNDIIIAENCIDNFINKKSKVKIKDTLKKISLINKNLNKYIRQYIGYINKKGQKIIFVNFLWFDILQYYGVYSFWKEYWIYGYNQGTDVWEIKVNLDKQKCFDFYVNKIKKEK